jgi:putative transposase
MERVRIFSLKGISRRQEAIVREGQMEAARVWTECRDMHMKARQEQTPWPGRNEYHKATRGRFALHSQSIQQVFRVFDAAVESTLENRRSGRKEMRYPYKDKRFFPLMWPAQAMCLKENRIVLPMGRGRPSLVFPRPEWLIGKSACKVVWNGVHNELHVSIEVADTALAAGVTEKHATVDLGQIHQAAQGHQRWRGHGRLRSWHSLHKAPAQQAAWRDTETAFPMQERFPAVAEIRKYPGQAHPTS